MPFFQPSLEEMNKEVLAWDLFHMLSGSPMYSLRRVPLKFSSVDEYLDVFEPLLLEECRAQTLRSMQENDDKDYNLQLLSVEAGDLFRVISFEAPANVDPKSFFYDNDLVFISYEQLDMEGGEDGGPKAQQFHALALVVGSTASAIRARHALRARRLTAFPRPLAHVQARCAPPRPLRLTAPLGVTLRDQAVPAGAAHVAPDAVAAQAALPAPQGNGALVGQVVGTQARVDGHHQP